MSVEAAEEEELTMERIISGNLRPPTCIGPPKRLAQTASLIEPYDVPRFARNQRGFGNCKMSVEVAEEEELTMERRTFRNLRHVACARPPKRLAQTIGHAGPSDALCFTSDQQEIGSCKRCVEAAEEAVLCMNSSIYGNVRPQGVAVGPMVGNLFPAGGI